MIKTIINYVNYHYQFCENIDSFLLTNNPNTNEYYIKSCLIYKYLYEICLGKNITLREVMSIMDNTDFHFISNSNVFKNHLLIIIIIMAASAELHVLGSNPCGLSCMRGARLRWSHQYHPVGCLRRW